MYYQRIGLAIRFVCLPVSLCVFHSQGKSRLAMCQRGGTAADSHSDFQLNSIELFFAEKVKLQIEFTTSIDAHCCFTERWRQLFFFTSFSLFSLCPLVYSQADHSFDFIFHFFHFCFFSSHTFVPFCLCVASFSLHACHWGLPLLKWILSTVNPKSTQKENPNIICCWRKCAPLSGTFYIHCQKTDDATLFAALEYKIQFKRHTLRWQS